MPLVIRMARAGTKKRPFYHIVAADSRAPRNNPQKAVPRKERGKAAEGGAAPAA